MTEALSSNLDQWFQVVGTSLEQAVNDLEQASSDYQTSYKVVQARLDAVMT